MKTYTIGRSTDCNIVVEDSRDVVSRHHATLYVSTWGKITIEDKSRNGTYINGSRISTGEKVPVSRKDTVSFAHAVELDWKKVPRTDIYLKCGVLAVAILLVAGIVWGVVSSTNDNGSEGSAGGTDTTAVDSVKVINDSIIQAQKDSIELSRQDSIVNVRVKEELEKEQKKGQKPSVQRNTKEKEEAPKSIEKAEENKTVTPIG